MFIRVDFNVPLENDKVAEDTRIRETLPTLRLAIERGARLVVASHLGRPKGKPNPKYTLMPVAARLRGIARAGPWISRTDCVGQEAESKSRALSDGDLLLLENVRFHPEEEANDEAVFAAARVAVRQGLRVRRIRLGASRARVGRWHNKIRRSRPQQAC